jgi:hypothetical protein
VPWWPRHNVELFNILVHLHEQLDGRTGFGAEDAHLLSGDRAFWDGWCAKIEQAAKSADSRDELS